MTAADGPAADKTAAGWEGILDPGERILWQGRPDDRIELRGPIMVPVLVGAFFAVFALIWIVAVLAGGEPLAALFGLLHFAVGAGLMVGAPLWQRHRLRHTWYTLTDRRAFIATDFRPEGRKLNSWPITPDMRLTLIEGPPDTLNFLTVTRRVKNRNRRVTVGFERIADGRAVMALMRGVQRAMAGTGAGAGPGTGEGNRA